MATWNKLNVDSAALNSGSLNTTNKSLWIGQRPGPVPVAAIYGNSDPSILDDPTTNAGKIFFDTAFDYFRIKKIVDFTITLPARNRRSTGGGKKSGSGYLSYNGYADHFIYQHDYGNPPPAFTVFVKGDSSNGVIANHGITGSIPLQFISDNSFRLGLTYSTDKYLVIRERYQVYGNDLPALTLNVRAHFFDNPTSVPAGGNLSVVHSPTFADQLNNSTYVWHGPKPPAGYADPRYITTTFSFTSQLSQTFDRVLVTRTGGKNSQFVSTDETGHYIDQINGSAVTAFDPFNGPTTYNYTQRNSWSMRVVTKTTARTASFSPTWRVEFYNSTTNDSYVDYVGAIHRFV